MNKVVSIVLLIEILNPNVTPLRTLAETPQIARGGWAGGEAFKGSTNMCYRQLDGVKFYRQKPGYGSLRLLKIVNVDTKLSTGNYD